MRPDAGTPRLPSTTAGRQLRRRLAAVAGVCLIGPLLVFLSVLAARQLEAQRSLGRVQAADAAEARAGRLLPEVTAALEAELSALAAAPVTSVTAALCDRSGKLLTPRLPPARAPRPPVPERLHEALAAGRDLEFRVQDAQAALHHFRGLLAHVALSERPAVLLELLGSYARAEDWAAADAVAQELLRGHARGSWSLARQEYLHAQLLRATAASSRGLPSPDLSGVLRELEATAAVEGPALSGAGFYRERLVAAGAVLDPSWQALCRALAARGEPLTPSDERVRWIPALRASLVTAPVDAGQRVSLLDLPSLLGEALAPAAQAGQRAVVRDPHGDAVWWSAKTSRPPQAAPQAPARVLVWREPPLRGWSLELHATDDAAAEAGYRRQRLILVALVLTAALVLVLATWGLLSQAARAVDLARARTDFVAGVTHDLKTPLALIRLYGETLQLHPDQDAAKRATFAGVVVREADRLHDLVENVLQLSRGEAATPQLDGSDLARTVSAAVAEYVLPPTPAFELVQRLEPELPEVLHAPTAVRQIVRNLLANAVKFSPAGGRIEVSLERDGAHALLAVSDAGVGIAAEDRERVFEAFVRLDAKGKPTPGSGLGLAIVRRLATLHRGTVCAAPRERGARIELRLPFTTP